MFLTTSFLSWVKAMRNDDIDDDEEELVRKGEPRHRTTRKNQEAGARYTEGHNDEENE